MGTIEESLAAGETVLYRTRLHWTVLFWPLVISALFAAGAAALFAAALAHRDLPAGGRYAIGGGIALALGVATLASGWLRRSSTEMAVTNRRVVMKSGIVSRRTVELLLTKVESVGVHQGLLGRVTDYGSIVVRGTGGTHELFDRVARPLEFRRRMQEQIDRIHHPAGG